MQETSQTKHLIWVIEDWEILFPKCDPVVLTSPLFHKYAVLILHAHGVTCLKTGNMIRIHNIFVLYLI